MPTAPPLPRPSTRCSQLIEQGYQAVRAQCGIPGLPSTYGVSADKCFYEPADKGLPAENVWSTEQYLRHVPKLFASVRAQLGDDVHLLHDVAPPADADPGGTARQGARAVSSVLARGRRHRPRCRKASGSSASTRRRRWRSVKCSTRCGTPSDLITRAADRLHRACRSRRRHHAAEEDRGVRRRCTTCGRAPTARPICRP